VKKKATDLGMDKDVDFKCVFEAIDKNKNDEICLGEFGMMFSDSDPTLPMKLDKCKETNDDNKDWKKELFEACNADGKVDLTLEEWLAPKCVKKSKNLGMDKDVDPKCVFEAIDKKGNNNDIICMAEFGLMFSDSDPALPNKVAKKCAI